MSKNPDSMPAIVNRKVSEDAPNEGAIETKSEGDEAVEDIKDE